MLAAPVLLWSLQETSCMLWLLQVALANGTCVAGLVLMWWVQDVQASCRWRSYVPDIAYCAVDTAYRACPCIPCYTSTLCQILHAALNPAGFTCRAMKRSGEITFNGGQLTKRHKRQIGFVMQVW